jgi:hypothetical protein
VLVALVVLAQDIVIVSILLPFSMMSLKSSLCQISQEGNFIVIIIMDMCIYTVSLFQADR